MAKIMILTFAWHGHTNPIQAVAERILQRGHQIIWMGRKVSDSAPITPRLANIEIRDIDWTWLTAGKSLDYAGAARDLNKYVAFSVAWRLEALEQLVPRLRQAIRDCAPDLIVCDGQMYAGVIAATHEHVPFVCAFTTPSFLMPEGFDCDLTRTLRLLDDTRAKCFSRHGVEPRFVAWEYVSPLENYVFALPELVGTHRELPAKTFLLGPAIHFVRPDDPSDYPWERLNDGAPIVYLSLGTLFYSQPDLFRTIAKVCAKLGLQLAATIGDLIDTPFAQELPQGVVATRYTPQLAMLERASVCITHGGANTVMESLYAGVPQLVIPLCADQPVNAFFVSSSGVGLSIPPQELTEERCRDALLKLVSSESPWRLASQLLRDAYRRSDGAEVAAARIDALLGRSE